MANLLKNNVSRNFSVNLSIWVSILGNVVLFSLKIWVGLVSSSVAVIADAWHTLSDSLSSVIVLAGVKFSEKKPTKRFPYGFGRVDIVASLFLSVLLFVVALEFFVRGLNKLDVSGGVVYSSAVYWVMGVSVVVKEVMARISFFAAKKSGKRSLKADGWHHRTDAFAAFIILVGVFLGKYFFWLDGVLGMFVSLIICYSAYGIIKDVFISIIGESPEVDLLRKIVDVSNRVSGMEVYPHHILVHDYGNHIEITMHIYLLPDLDILSAHSLTDVIERGLKEELGVMATIHVEPMPEGIGVG